MSKTYTIALEFLDHPVELGCMIYYPWGSSEVTHVPPGAHIESEEIAALKAERNRLTIIADAIQAERDRLRAALEQIAYVPDWENRREIARRALEEK